MLLAFNEQPSSAQVGVPALAAATGLPLDELHRVLLSLTSKVAPLLVRSSAAAASSAPPVARSAADDDGDDASESGGGGGGGVGSAPRVANGETFAFNAKFASKMMRIKINALQVASCTRRRSTK